MREAATGYELDCVFEDHDAYPATHNDPSFVAALRSVCDELDVDVHMLEHPFPWSDDFGHFAASGRGLYFGLGIGKDAPGLHELGYAFPDDVMQTGIAVLSTLARSLTEDSRLG